MTEVHWVPLQYTISHIPPRHRTVSNPTVYEDYPVGIPTADSSEVRRIATLTRSKDEKFVAPYDSHGMWTGDDPDISVDIVLHDGRLYRNVVDAMGRRLAMAAIKERPAEVKSHLLGNPFSKHSTWPRDVRFRDEIEIGRFVSDTRDQAIAELQEIASTLLVVDGMLYRPTPEPVLELRTREHQSNWGRNFNGFSLHVLMYGRRHLSGYGTIFRLDELDEAKRIGQSCATERRPFRVFGELELHDASMLRENVRAESIERLYKESRDIGFHGFCECTTTDIRKWCEAEDLLKAGDHETGAVVLREFHTAARERLQSSHALSLGLALDRYECLPAPDLELIGGLTF